jgi:hypothetical protein
MGRHEIANLLRAKLEGHNPPQDEDDEQQAPGLNSDDLLPGLARALKIDLDSTSDDDANDDSL